MSVILNEREWIEKMIAQRDLGRFPSVALTTAAKYFKSNGCSRREVERRVELYLLQSNPTASLTQWAKRLEKAVADGMKYPLIEIEGVDITKSEMEKIATLKSVQAQRLAFTLLCLAKFFHIAKGIDYWVNTPDSEIMSMANISTPVRRQSELFAQLRDAGLIQFSKKIDNLSVRVLIVDDDSDVALHVSDFRNLGNRYRMYRGGPYFECQHCGLAIRKSPYNTGRPRKYCKECAVEVKAEQDAARAER